MSRVDPSTASIASRAGSSLATAVRLASEILTVDLDRDEIVAALGWSWLVCAVPDETNPTYWPLYARDAFLTEACELFGLSVRAVHPPRAACGLWGIAEFRQHFDASYRPIIENALDNGQPVLAWRGWTGKTVPTWGMITQTCDGGIHLAGHPCDEESADCNEATTPLDQPPVQVYAVESGKRRRPSPTRIAEHLTNVASRALSGELDDSFAIVTGPPAIDLWIDGFVTRRIDNTACAEMLHSLRQGQESLRRVLGKNDFSVPLRESRARVADILSNLNDSNPLPALKSLRDHFVTLRETLSIDPH